MNICLFSEDEIGKPLLWHDERAQHLIKVLHKNEGDSFTAGIIEGLCGTATITKINNKTSIEYTFKAEAQAKPLYPLSMIIGFPRPIQLKRLLRDMAGLGTDLIHLTGTELGEKSYLKSNLLERGSATQMLLDGTVQAGSTHIPKLFMHQNLCDCIKEADSQRKTETDIPVLKIALDNINPKCPLKDFIEDHLNTHQNPSNAPKFKAIAAIGSERGWTEKERNFLENNGFTRCSMGKRILRTESAATVAASIILNYMGVLD